MHGRFIVRRWLNRAIEPRFVQVQRETLARRSNHFSASFCSYDEWKAQARNRDAGVPAPASGGTAPNRRATSLLPTPRTRCVDFAFALVALQVACEKRLRRLMLRLAAYSLSGKRCSFSFLIFDCLVCRSGDGLGGGNNSDRSQVIDSPLACLSRTFAFLAKFARAVLELQAVARVVRFSRMALSRVTGRRCGFRGACSSGG